MGNDIHACYKETNKLHSKVSSYDGGACLIKHVTQFVDNNSCSYRWQGVHKAEMQPGRAAYDAHRNPKHHVGQRSTGAFDPANATSVTKSAGMAGVLKGMAMTKSKLFSLIEVLNFTTGRVPYGNQVHHLLNASSLRNGIDPLSEIWLPIRETIISGLLSEKYNINDHNNNLILPTSAYHCRETGLPRHYGSHPKYNMEIRDRVKLALKPYEAIANQMKKAKTHDKPKPKPLKSKLLAISETMYTNIIALAIALAAANRANRAKREFVTINNLPRSAFASVPSV
jgi:hypothetical protein